MRKETCCFTGHRKIPSDQYAIVAKRLNQEIIKLIHKGVVYFGTGGALGFDTMAAQAVINLRNQYPQIKLILVLPCKTQTRYWHDADKITYENIRKASNKYVYVSDEYTYDCMYKRNRHLVSYSGYCICYLTENFGGTAYTVEYAKRNGLKVINIACENR